MIGRCGHALLAKRRGRPPVWCSAKCRRAACAPTPAKRRADEHRRRDPRCRACGAPIAGRGRRYCSTVCLPTETAYNIRHAGPAEVGCRQCRGPIPSPKYGKGYCSIRCRTSASSSRRPGNSPSRGQGRRFPRIRYAARLAILERDHWRCRICGAPIDPARTFPDPGFATIDHIDPDGPHKPSNWQAAHLVCNVSKGRKLRPGADPKLRRATA